VAKIPNIKDEGVEMVETRKTRMNMIHNDMCSVHRNQIHSKSCGRKRKEAEK
jgi:hypothetical protein